MWVRPQTRLKTKENCDKEKEERNHPSGRRNKKTRGRKSRPRKAPPGWPLCSRGCLIVHFSDPDPSALRPGDFYFLASPVGVSLKWRASCGSVLERCLDAPAFCSEMAALVAEDDEGEEERRALLVAGEEGISRVAVGRLLEELFEGSWRRSRMRCTRDSWVQTEQEGSNVKIPSNPAPDKTVEDKEDLRSLAPLASEEEFCSDTEPKAEPPQENDEPGCPPPKSPLPEVKQHSAISSLVENAFSSHVASMPGSRDMCCRSVVYISLENMQDHNIEPVYLAEILLYFQSIPKRETMCLGFLVIVDGRNVETESWSSLHKTLALVEETVPGTISLVLALQKNKTEFLPSKYPIFHLKFEPIVNENQLLQYVTKDQLLPEFGGTYEYDHHEWTNFHEFLDPFIVSCHQTGCRLVQLIQDLRYGQLPSVLTHQLIEEQKKQIMEVLENEQLRYLEEEGSAFLKKLDEYHSTFPNNLDYEEAVEKSKLLYKQLKKVVQRLARLADKRLNKLQECMMLKVFEEESSQVLSWLHRKGEETLKKHKTLAETLNAIREQENEFEKFYFLAMRQIERGNDLLEEIPKLQSSDKEKGISANLKKQLDDFTDRLEDARETLEDTSRCYQLLDKTYEWALETMRFVSHMKVDSTTSVNALVTIMKRLESYLQDHPYLEDGIFEEMAQLTIKLNNPNLSNQCQVAKAKYEETVDLIQTRLETLIKAKERLSYEERPNINDSLDNLKIKPCLWNPLSQNATYRSSSQSHLGSFNQSHGSQGFRREAVGSYTAFPSSYYPASSFRERLLGLSQRKKRTDYFTKRGSLTDEVVLGRLNTSESDSSSRAQHGRKSYPFSSDSLTNLNIQISSTESKELQSASSVSSKTKLDSEGNWKVFDSELKKYADEVREQNRMLEQNRLVVQQETVNLRNRNMQENNRPMSANYYTSSNPEEFQKPAPANSHLMRCASCSDFEELLSGKTSEMENLKLANNRTLKLVMMEMIQTERDYVKSLGYIIENYVPLLQNSNVSQALRSQRNVIFGNIEKIYEFHNCYFLQELEQCESIPYSVGQCFLKYESQFYLYAMYNKNKPKSDSLMAEYGNNFFKKKQYELGDKMDLASYLLKPVQRMGKYALLLKQLLKECPETSSEHYNNLKAAEEMVRFQLRHGNDLLAMDALRECDVNIKEQGRLLRQDEFLVCQGGKSRKALRHVFLFEDLILFSKARRDPSCKGNEYYQYKSSIKTSDLGLTAQVGESATKFEIWFRKCKTQDLYVLQAPSAEIKNAWVEEISGLLWKQAERNRNLRLEEMSSMGIGNKPCLDITPSRDQICDRSISLQQLNKVPRFRNSIAVSSSDNFNNNEPRRRPLSIISLGGSSSSGEGQGTSIFYDTTDPLEEVEETETDKRRSVAQQSQCSAESGIFTDLSTSGDSYVENVNRLKTVERSDSLLSRTSYNSIEATTTETSTATSSLPSGLAV
ncbi:pleckstrin homology domain-containing family G member 4B [Nephila pilipes]|uniref:Pleckstrin homology domain-containing family G member 4B n=1 Tax=Nephila pilipes TaxID=299642 RepID=A0A8X6I3X2_NEPPI|nr:pleckstrin homology domain-containing family G member 4B [Nephila pilipes]